MATTTNRYLSYPELANGQNFTLPASYAFTAWNQIVPVNTITSTFYIAGFCWAWTGTGFTAGTDQPEFLFELGTGAAASEITIIQVPAQFKFTTNAGYYPLNFVTFSEPVLVAANTRVSVRGAQSLTATTNVVTGIKIMYQIV